MCIRDRDPHARDELIARGSARALEYDWDTVADQIMTVYETVVGAANVKGGKL